MFKRLIPKSAALLAAIVACAAIHGTAFGDDAAKAAAAKKRADAERKLHESFFARFNEAYAEQMGTPVYTPPAPTPALDGKDDKEAKEVTPQGCQRRGFPAPFDGPPYPNGEWQIGGTQIIGDPANLNDNPYPLMQAIYDGPNGDAWRASRFQIYGWEDVSGNISTSHNISPKNTSPGPNANFPEVYDLRPNRVEQNQAVLYLERQPDECQTDHIDWGFRISGVYGLDYRYMISRGFLDRQLLQHNNYYGFDMPMMYFNLYIPNIFMGMNITIGRIISEADIEAQLAPNNLMSSHSLLYGFDPYTDWGVFFTLKLNKNWQIQWGIDAGGDVAPWQSDPGRQATGTLMFQWISDDNKLSWYGGANQFNNANFGYNNLQQYVGTWTYKFNEKVWTTWETWYMYMKHTTTAPTYDVPYQNGFFTTRGGYAPEFATLDYTMFRLANNTFFTVRNEFFNDMNGSRTGFTAKYYETSIGITWWPNKIITVRPELRYERSWEAKVYDNGTRYNQVTAQMDVVWHF